MAKEWTDSQPKELLADLWREYRRTRDPELLKRLCTEYLHLIDYFVKTYLRACPAHVEADDLFQFGFLGLRDAARNFDPEQTVFETYSSSRIWGAIVDGVRTNDRLTRTMRWHVTRLEDAVEGFKSQHGHPPSEAQVRKLLKIDAETYRKCLVLQAQARDVSLSSEPADHHATERVYDYHANLPDTREPDNDRLTLAKEVRDFATRHLTREDAFILNAYVFDELTLREIAASLGVCQSLVSKKWTNIVKRLAADDRLKKFLEDSLDTA